LGHDFLFQIDAGLKFIQRNPELTAVEYKEARDIARAKGMTQVARDAGLSRESLYKALSGERSPEFDTILKVISALGLKLHAAAAHTTKIIA